MIVIAYRLSTVLAAGQVVVLSGGRGVEVGAWRELASDPEGRLNALLPAAGGGVPGQHPSVGSDAAV